MEANQSVLRGQAEIWKYMFSFVDSMALRCAVDFRIADIIHSHSGPITLSQIVSSFPFDDYSSPPDITSLARIMRLLVRRNIFTATAHHSNGEDCWKREWTLMHNGDDDDDTKGKFNLAYHDYRRNEVENWRVKEEWGKKEEGER
ncbi:hypothetical protein FNV43_RR00416 [Rhamnella rubrinervis]|uniref:O-methyltransferase dimerisation domain-containing protein n=1 Tax=Rhamnella rubrinervis TaxID=2594499 RepID=A0A8K0HQK9_9ROSA|nr:hypothetical protein FNV43_RR00416 [Rhamnella rubrinervis]